MAAITVDPYGVPGQKSEDNGTPAPVPKLVRTIVFFFDDKNADSIVDSTKIQNVLCTPHIDPMGLTDQGLESAITSIMEDLSIALASGCSICRTIKNEPRKPQTGLYYGGSSKDNTRYQYRLIGGDESTEIVTFKGIVAHITLNPRDDSGLYVPVLPSTALRKNLTRVLAAIYIGNKSSAGRTFLGMSPRGVTMVYGYNKCTSSQGTKQISNNSTSTKDSQMINPICLIEDTWQDPKSNDERAEDIMQHARGLTNMAAWNASLLENTILFD